MSPPTVEKDKSIPSFATANAAAETAYRAAAAAAERLRSEDEGGSKPATNATNASWAQRPSSKAGTGNATKPSPKVFPERDGFNAGRARRSSPVNEGGWDFCMGIGWNFYDYVSATLCNWMDILVYSLCWPSCPLLFWPCSSTTFWLGSLWQGQGMTLDSTDNVKFPKNGCENCSLSSNMSMMLQSVDILYIYTVDWNKSSVDRVLIVLRWMFSFSGQDLTKSPFWGGKSDAKAAAAPTSDSNLPPEVRGNWRSTFSTHTHTKGMNNPWHGFDLISCRDCSDTFLCLEW